MYLHNDINTDYSSVYTVCMVGMDLSKGKHCYPGPWHDMKDLQYLKHLINTKYGLVKLVNCKTMYISN